MKCWFCPAQNGLAQRQGSNVRGIDAKFNKIAICRCTHLSLERIQHGYVVGGLEDRGHDAHCLTLARTLAERRARMCSSDGHMLMTHNTKIINELRYKYGVPVGGCLPAGRRCPGAVNIARRWGRRVAGGLTADPLTGDFT